MNRGSCVVRFAGNRVTIQWNGEASESIVRFLYPDSADGSEEGGGARIEGDEHGRTLTVRLGNDVLYRGDCKGSAAVALMRWSVHALATDCRKGLLFHAAALSSGGRGILLPGASGNGKSTLSAWLTGNGLDYLSDELACVQPGGLTIDAFFRPVHFKGTSVSVLERLGCLEPFDSAEPEVRGLQSDRGRLVPISALNSTNVIGKPQLGLLVFPKYDASESELRTERVPKARVVMRLMEHLINARNFEDHGFQQATALAEHVPAYEMTYPSFDGIVETLEELLSPRRR